MVCHAIPVGAALRPSAGPRGILIALCCIRHKRVTGKKVEVCARGKHATGAQEFRCLRQKKQSWLQSGQAKQINSGANTACPRTLEAQKTGIWLWLLSLQNVVLDRNWERIPTAIGNHSTRNTSEETLPQGRGFLRKAEHLQRTTAAVVALQGETTRYFRFDHVPAYQCRMCKHYLSQVRKRM